ncbi:MAG: hypothetical protein ACI9MC_003028 [Kiritimatiellia bacterium]
MARRRRSGPDGMQAAADVYAFLALVSLLLLAVARFQPATASDAVVGSEVQGAFETLRLDGLTLVGDNTQLDAQCLGPMADEPRFVLDVPLDGSASADTVQHAWDCLSQRAPGRPVQIRWH